MCPWVVETDSVCFVLRSEDTSVQGPSQNVRLGKRSRSCFGEICSNRLVQSTPPPTKLARRNSVCISSAVCHAAALASLPYGVRSERGGRTYMEDTYKIVPSLIQLSAGPVDFYSVYDGHGGDYVAKYCSHAIHHHVKTELENTETQASVEDGEVESALIAAFKRTNEELERSGKAKLVGSTAVAVLVTPESFFVASCGDSRAVLCRKGEAIALTKDHSPEREDEQKRIKEHGGCVTYRHGMYRVMGALAVSRAIGDHVLQQYGVTYKPDTSCLKRTANDDLLLLASDGLFSVLSNEAAVELARLSLERARSRGANKHAAARIAANVLIRIALNRGAQDNVTVMVVDLSSTSPKLSDAGAPKMS